MLSRGIKWEHWPKNWLKDVINAFYRSESIEGIVKWLKKKRPSFSFIVSTEESSQEKFLNNNQHPSLQKQCIMWTVFNRFPQIFSKVTAFNPDF